MSFKFSWRLSQITLGQRNFSFFSSSSSDFSRYSSLSIQSLIHNLYILLYSFLFLDKYSYDSGGGMYQFRWARHLISYSSSRKKVACLSSMGSNLSGPVGPCVPAPLYEVLNFSLLHENGLIFI